MSASAPARAEPILQRAQLLGEQVREHAQLAGGRGRLEQVDGEVRPALPCGDRGRGPEGERHLPERAPARRLLDGAPPELDRRVPPALHTGERCLAGGEHRLHPQHRPVEPRVLERVDRLGPAGELDPGLLPTLHPDERGRSDEAGPRLGDPVAGRVGGLRDLAGQLQRGVVLTSEVEHGRLEPAELPLERRRADRGRCGPGVGEVPGCAGEVARGPSGEAERPPGHHPRDRGGLGLRHAGRAELGGHRDVATDHGRGGQHGQHLRPPRCGLLRPAGEDPASEREHLGAPALVHRAEHGEEQAERPVRGVVPVEAPLDCGDQVPEVVGHGGQELGRPALHAFGDDVIRPSRDRVDEGLGDRVPLAAAHESLEPVLAQQLEDPVTGREGDRHRRHQRPFDELGEQVDRPQAVGAVGRHHAVSQLDVEQPREDTETLEGRSLVVVQQLHGHVDRGADAAMAGTEVALASVEQVEAVLGVAQVVGGREHPGTSRRQLDGERQPVEAAAQLADRGQRRLRSAPTARLRTRPVGGRAAPPGPAARRRRRSGGRAHRGRAAARRRDPAAPGSWRRPGTGPRRRATGSRTARHRRGRARSCRGPGGRAGPRSPLPRPRARPRRAGRSPPAHRRRWGGRRARRSRRHPGTARPGSGRPR